MKIWNILLMAANTILLVFNMQYLCSHNPYMPDASINYVDVILAVYSVLVTILIGWNIWNTINAQNELKEIRQQANDMQQNFDSLKKSFAEEWRKGISPMVGFYEQMRGLQTKDESLKYALALFAENGEKSFAGIFAKEYIVSYIKQELKTRQEEAIKASSDVVTQKLERMSTLASFAAAVDKVKYIDVFIEYLGDSLEQTLKDVRDVLLQARDLYMNQQPNQNQ